MGLSSRWTNLCGRQALGRRDEVPEPRRRAERAVSTVAVQPRPVVTDANQLRAPHALFRGPQLGIFLFRKAEWVFASADEQQQGACCEPPPVLHLSPSGLRAGGLSPLSRAR